MIVLWLPSLVPHTKWFRPGKWNVVLFYQKQFRYNCIDAQTRPDTSCTRTLTEVENTMFCSFNDNENFLELYDLNQDPYQLYNMVSQVSPDVLQAYRDKTTALKM